jgi:integrase
MRKILTDALLRGLKAPATGRLEVADLKCVGLSFRLTPNGVASWTYRYRDAESGKPGRFKIGDYPQTSLKAARLAADRLRSGVSSGLNPSAQKRKERRERTSKSFGSLAERYLEGHAKQRKRSWQEDERMLNSTILPAWADRRIDAITRLDVIELLDGIVQRGCRIEANRTQSLISMLFSYALDEGVISAHPVVRLRKRGGEERPRQRTLSDSEIAELWSGIVEPPVTRGVGLALRLALLTGMRAGEVAGIHRSELVALDDDGSAHVLLPESRVKTKNVHLVPLTGLGLLVAREAASLSTTQFLFPGRWKEQPIRAASLHAAMRLFCHDRGGTWLENKPTPTPHDFRRVVRSAMAKLGVPAEHAREVLNHGKVGVDDRVYNVHRYEGEKRVALQLWSDLVAGVIAGK